MKKEVDLLKHVDEEQKKTTVGEVSQHQILQAQERAAKAIKSTRVDLSEPVTYHEAVLGKEAANRQDVMETQMQSMYDNQVWELVDLPPKG
ncbi:hypothetical protein Tco_0434803 [Tanacetum coccineum]